METLKIQQEELAERQTQLTVEVPPELIREAMQRAAREMSKRSKIAGFRPGKAPFEMVVQRYGEEAVFEEALDSLGQEVYRRALEQAEVDPVAPGSLDEVVSREPLLLRYTVPLTPQVDLGSYRDLRLSFEVPSVEDPAVAEVLESLRQQQALIEPADRPSASGDVVVLDVQGRLVEPDPESANATLLDEKGVSLLLTEATDFPFPGVASQLEGISGGETRQVDHTFAENYRNESLRGRAARFTFVCQTVKSRLVPEWSDDLARTLGEFSDLADLRAKVRESLEAQSRRRAEAEYAEQVIGAAVEGATFRYPPVLLQRELDDAVHDLEERLKQQRLSLADYLRIEGKTDEELRTELEPQARRRLERGLLLGEVVEVEGLEVGDDEVETEVGRLVEPLSDSGDRLRRALDQPAARRRIALDLLTDKSVARLVQIARGETVSVAAEVAAEATASEQGDGEA